MKEIIAEMFLLKESFNNMKAKFTDDQLKPGAKFIGNVNGAICEVVKIENPVTSYELDWKGDLKPKTRNTVVVVTLKDFKTGHTFQYGLEALKRCDITIC